MRCSRKGFSLVELLAVLMITGIGATLFSVVFVNNWFAYEDRINRANLLNESNQIIDQMSFEGRNAKLVDVVTGADKTTVTYTNAVDSSLVLFELHTDGTLTMTKNKNTRNLTTHLDYVNSSIVQEGATNFNFKLIVSLALKDGAGTRDIHVTAGSEIYLRN